MARGRTETRKVIESVKTGELVLGFSRFPFVTDKEIIKAFRGKAQDELKDYNASLTNPRIRKVTLISEELVFDVLEPKAQALSPSPLDPVTWAVIIFALLAIATGALVVLAIVLYLRVVSLEKTIGEIGKGIDEAIAEKEIALAEGKIDAGYARELNKILWEAKSKAEDAGVTDWWNMLEKILPMIPLAIGAFILIALVGAIPKRRD